MLQNGFTFISERMKHLLNIQIGDIFWFFLVSFYNLNSEYTNIFVMHVVGFLGYKIRQLLLVLWFDQAIEHAIDTCCGVTWLYKMTLTYVGLWNGYRTCNWHMRWGYWAIGHELDLYFDVTMLKNMQATYDVRLLGYRTWPWLMLWCDHAIEHAIANWHMLWTYLAIEHDIDLCCDVTRQ